MAMIRAIADMSLTTQFHDDDDEDDEDTQQDQDSQGGGGTFATLQNDGPQVSAGSVGHPDTCMPCTFYCFTRRGCNRGMDCKFCHSAHQSKLQQRRESWKKQQREKRKLIRERMASEALARRHDTRDPTTSQQTSSPQPPQEATTQPPQGGAAAARLDAAERPSLRGTAARHEKSSQQEQRTGTTNAAAARGSGSHASASTQSMDLMKPAPGFSYSPASVILTIGQEVAYEPMGIPPNSIGARFSLLSAAPAGLNLDSNSGAIYGAPTAASAKTAIRVQAEFRSGQALQASLEVEVVDLTRGGYVVGHISEFETGKFMMLLYVPDDLNENAAGGDRGGSNSGAVNGQASRGDPTAPQRNYLGAGSSNGQTASTSRRTAVGQRVGRRSNDNGLCTTKTGSPRTVEDICRQAPDPRHVRQRPRSVLE